MNGRGDQDPVRRGLLLLGWGLAIAAALSLTLTGLFQWLISHVREQGDGYQSVMDIWQAIAWWRVGGSTATGVMVITGCWLLTRAGVGAGRSRMWGTVALVAAAAGLGVTLLLFALQLSDAASPWVTRLVACESAASLVLFGAIGLSVRGLVRGSGGSVSAAAIGCWSIGLGLDAILAVVYFVEPAWLYGDTSWYLLFGVTMVVDLSRPLLIFAARRVLGRSIRATGDGEMAAPAGPEGEEWRRVAEGLSLYRGALIVQVVIACVGFAAVASALIDRSESSLGTFGLLLPVAEVIVAIMMVAGLLRYAANLPRETSASGGAIAGVVCTVLGGVLKLYVFSLVWRVHSVTHAARDSGFWGGSSVDDLLEQAERMPWIELAATTLALFGLCLVLGSLRTLAHWLGRRELETRTARLTAGMAVLVIVTAAVRWFAASTGQPIGVIVVLGIMALAGALVLFVQYVGLLRELVEALRGQRPAVPPARVVASGDGPGRE